MGSLGKTLVGVGIFSFVLPLFGFQFVIVDIFGEAWPLASVGFILLGGFMMFQSSAREKEAINNLVALTPKDYAGWCDKGDLLFQIGKKEEAIKAYDQAIRLKPDFAEAWYNKSAALASVGKVDDAVEARNRALKLKPELNRNDVSQ
ncbi:tetratricopeptide repeat protein [Methanosarcina sp. KYL-1]|uniref:tetratricopeptide repeat protein n=1 Tax=Methanosarcina sp. KYL-1 TaxID=2602068 RepID=UPI0021017326|nr:tetratricopeptide repeat protein [Methanosarcina sp. KYL-1]MCQ1536398.1 tetratricopeptide repeat protein [Methanosarcina sp. KYL-1]